MGIKRWSVSQKTARKILEKTGGNCYYCREKLPKNTSLLDDVGKEVVSIRNWHVDHLIPLSRGGDYSFENLVPSCSSCNSKKSNMTAEEFMATL